jgi:hypothetical protein
MKLLIDARKNEADANCQRRKQALENLALGSHLQTSVPSDRHQTLRKISNPNTQDG